MTSIQELEQKLQQLESILKEKDEQYNRLMVDSRRAVDLALHAYKVDHYGYIWTYSPDDGLYHKTNMRVATPEIADRAIQTRHLVSKCVTSEKIADKAVTRDKLSEEVINELRMVDIQDLYFGDYYTKEEVERMLQEVDVDLSEYYKKTETYSAAEIRRMVAGLNPDLSGYYTKDDVDRMLRAIRNGRFVPVSALPTASADTLNAIYLVPRESEEGEENNVKDEFITISSGSGENITYSWEKIGSTDINLSGYATEDWVNRQGFLVEGDIPGAPDLSGYAKTSDLDDYAKTSDLDDYAKTEDIPATPTWDDIKPEGGITDDDLSDELAQQLNSIPSDVTVGGKIDKVSGNHTDEIAVFEADNNEQKSHLKASGKKLADLALKSDVDGKVGNISAEPFSAQKSYAVGDYCTKGVASGVVILWKCKTAHQGEWSAEHFEDVTDHILVVGWNGCVKDSGKKVSEFLTAHQSLDEYAKKTDLFSGSYEDLTNKPTIPAAPDLSGYALKTELPDVSGKADKMVIVVNPSVQNNAIAVSVGNYYRFDNDVARLAITLNTPSDTGNLGVVVISLKTSGTFNSNNITFTAQDNKDICYFEGFSLKAGLSYELNCMWNGSKWIIAYGVFN